MKILAFSDLHRDQNAARAIVDASRNADVIIGAGDFATFAEGAFETLEILKDCRAPVLVLHGNHDIPNEISGFCENWNGGHYLHGQAVMIDGHQFFGMGGEIPSRNSHSWNAAETEDEATRLLSTCPCNAVLITHTPPLGTADLQKTGVHDGSAAICAAITAYSPKLLLCGHIHNAWGTQGRVGATNIHNLGPSANWFDI